VHLVGHRLDVSDDGPWRDNAPSRLVLLGVKPMLRLPDEPSRFISRKKI
jgi:hypothetical protein